MEATAMTMSTIPNIITSSPSGGRFDFDDGGTYCGGWQDGKAHGHGVCTGPKNVGEYSGSWNFGFEMSGVYKWTNGAVYEGRWQNGKRHGVGVEYNGKWIYKGEWSQGLKGRYGVKASSNSAVKYEGTWANGLQDGYGSETYSDGGYYQGQMCRGLRHGYGVRKSAPYGDSQLNNPSKNGPLTGGPNSSMLLHSNSIQSTGSTSDLAGGMAQLGANLSAVSGGGGGLDEDDSPKPEDGFKPNIDRTLVSKNGFVLVAKPLDVPLPQAKHHSTSGKFDTGGAKRRSSLTKLVSSARIPNQTGSLFRHLRLRKQKSTSDLDVLAGGGGGRSGAGYKSGSAGLHAGGANQLAADSDLPIVPFTLSPEELDITDPTTVETYTGEWKHDKRNGHGVCDRSDGLKYEGQWHNDMKSGYGITTFKDGSKEEGKYKNNILVVDSKVKRFFQLGGSNIRQRIDDAVKMANQAQTMALKKAEIAGTRAATARDKADQAMTAAIEANRDSQIAYSVARQYSDSQQIQQFNLQQQLGFAAQAGQQAGFMFNPMDQQQQSFMARNLNMANSGLQMRRISQQRNLTQQQQQQQQFNNTNQTFQQQQQQRHQQQQQQHQFGQQYNQSGTDQNAVSNIQANSNPATQQFLGPVEPFNGRRGSFRGGSQPPSGLRVQPRSMQHQQHYPTGPMQSMRQASADPFGDLFDHYKSGSQYTGGTSGPGGVSARRSMLTKQTSLDYQQLRQASVPPRHLGGGGGGGAGRSRAMRMSSLDHADENHYNNQFNRQAGQDPMQDFDVMSRQQQQFRHLVTSGEDQHQASMSPSNNKQHNQEDQFAMQTNNQNNPTPTGDSYILPHSSAADSSYNASNQTPSPSNDLGQQHPFYNRQQQQQQQQSSFVPGAQFGNRDNQSLADEQLYLANRRRHFRDQQTSSGSEYSKNDFSISSAPRPSQRCMRRTASLSRTTPLMGNTSLATGARLRPFEPARSSGTTPVSGSIISLSGGLQKSVQQQSRQQFQPLISISPTGDDSGQAFDAPRYVQHQQFTGNMGNFITPDSNPQSAAGHLTANNSCNSSNTSSVSPLSRKPSLQVRYDPMELGGLMSREEVAALSHAQREQKRLEAELVEKRAKRPFLYFYLAFKELISRHQLILSVLIVNICLLKLFADLIV